MGESKSKVKKVMWSEVVQQLKVFEDDLGMLHFKYSYDSDCKRCKFKTTNIGYHEMSRTAKKSQMY